MRQISKGGRMQANGENSAEQGSRIIRPILDETPLRAASFIVTIYGDVVERAAARSGSAT